MDAATPINPVFDCDQHWYEPTEAFTRHIPKEWRTRTIQVATIENRVRYVIGGKVNYSIANPTFNPIAKPGSLADYFRGNSKKLTLEQCLLDREPLPASFHNRDARLIKNTELGIEKAWLLPTVGMGFEEDLQYDPPAASVAFHAFNQWVEDDWGFNYHDRIYSAAYLAMGDVQGCVKEVEWALSRGCKVFVVRPTGTFTDSAWHSPGSACFDPIWARLDEAGVTVVPHVGETGDFGLTRFQSHGRGIIAGNTSPLQVVVGHDRPIENYLGAIICDRLFDRFKKVRIASVENGAGFLPNLLHGLARAHFQRPGYFTEDPVETFRKHVWVSPFWEDKLEDAVELIGASQVIWGSDWPHAEALARPRDYDDVVANLNDPVAARKIMYSNTAMLTGIAA